MLLYIKYQNSSVLTYIWVSLLSIFGGVSVRDLSDMILEVLARLAGVVERRPVAEPAKPTSSLGSPLPCCASSNLTSCILVNNDLHRKRGKVK